MSRFLVFDGDWLLAIGDLADGLGITGIFR